MITPAEPSDRPTQKAFKGFELYSWQDSNGSWLFALLPGTNRRKTEHEIKKKENRISGIEELGKRFSGLAEGEYVFWFNSDAKGFAFPDDAIVNQIKLLARGAKIELNLP